MRNAKQYLTRSTRPWVKCPNASEASYNPKQRSYIRTKLFFCGDISCGYLSSCYMIFHRTVFCIGNVIETFFISSGVTGRCCLSWPILSGNKPSVSVHRLHTDGIRITSPRNKSLWMPLSANLFPLESSILTRAKRAISRNNVATEKPGKTLVGGILSGNPHWHLQTQIQAVPVLSYLHPFLISFSSFLSRCTLSNFFPVSSLASLLFLPCCHRATTTDIST